MTLEQLRTNKGLTIKQMASYMGISTKTYNKRKDNFPKCKCNEIIELCLNLDLSESELCNLVKTNMKNA